MRMMLDGGAAFAQDRHSLSWLIVQRARELYGKKRNLRQLFQAATDTIRLTVDDRNNAGKVAMDPVEGGR